MLACHSVGKLSSKKIYHAWSSRLEFRGILDCYRHNQQPKGGKCRERRQGGQKSSHCNCALFNAARGGGGAGWILALVPDTTALLIAYAVREGACHLHFRRAAQCPEQRIVLNGVELRHAKIVNCSTVPPEIAISQQKSAPLFRSRVNLVLYSIMTHFCVEFSTGAIFLGPN
jgi:hypothetical protein